MEPLFVGTVPLRNADILNDNEEGRGVAKGERPRRNEPIPARYLNQIYSMAVVMGEGDKLGMLTGGCQDEIFGCDYCYSSDKRMERALLYMDQSKPALFVLETISQELLMRQGSEEEGAKSEGSGSGGTGIGDAMEGTGGNQEGVQEGSAQEASLVRDAGCFID